MPITTRSPSPSRISPTHPARSDKDGRAPAIADDRGGIHASEAWCVGAVARRGSAPIREFCGILALRVGGTDVDKDWKISAADFDGSRKNIASLNRCSGVAPSWEEEYGTIPCWA